MNSADVLILRNRLKQEREVQREHEKQLVKTCVKELKNSSITEAQITSWFRKKGITRVPTIERLAYNVRLSYHH